MLKLLLYILGCSITSIAGVSIVFDSPSSQTQYVFDPSKVDLTWYYKVSGTSNIPNINVHAEIAPGKYQRILLLLGNRNIPLKTVYSGRLTGWRNMSFASVTIRNLSLTEYTSYKIEVGYTELTEKVEAITTIAKGVNPSKPIITCGEKEKVSNITVKEGDDVECSCSSTGAPSPEVVWKLPELRRNGSKSVLKKEKISRNESNVYTCVAINPYGAQNESVLDVKVRYPPSLPNVITTKTSSFIGQKVSFFCSAEADPAPKYLWKTPDRESFSSAGNNRLVVSLHSSNQFGAYSCSASNVYGNNTSSVTLKQLFVPSKPHLIPGKRETFKLSVKWSEPNSTGGSVIVGYFIKISHGTRTIHTKATNQLEYKIDQLQRNTKYTLCVWAKNIVGNGTESCVEMKTSNKGPPNVPSKPTLTFNGDHNTLTVKWDKVLGNATYYIVEYRRDNKIWTRELAKLEYEINVIRGKTYYVRIIAGNGHGFVEGEVASVLIPTPKPSTSIFSTTTEKTTVQSTQSTKKPAEVGESSGGVPTGIIAMSVLLALVFVLAVIVLALWLKRRSGHSRISQRDADSENAVQHMPGPLGDLYAVVESKNSTKTGKNDGKDLVYAELLQFNPEASGRTPEPHHTEYADISHILTQPDADNDYEDIPPRSDEGAYASVDEIKRSNSITV